MKKDEGESEIEKRRLVRLLLARRWSGGRWQQDRERREAPDTLQRRRGLRREHVEEDAKGEP